MRKFFQTIKNIWSIEDLRLRILTTLSLLLVYRLGSYVVLPGVDAEVLKVVNDAKAGGGIMDLINIFAGGAFSRASIFALGIMPYISASIVIQLLGMAIPYFQRLQKEGESGRRKINQMTRVLTIAITGFQAPGYIASQITNSPGVVPDSGPLWWFSTVLLLITGTVFVMWIGERITEKGIGNGISLLIMIGIIANLPSAFVFEIGSRFGVGGVGGPIILLVEVALLLIVIIVGILLVQGTRRIPVQYAKRVVGNKQYGGVRQYIPLKVNAAGVMPIIFAQAIMFVPMTVASFGQSGTSSWIINVFGNPNGFGYNLTFFLMIVAFTYFYTAVTVNPNQMADDMKRNGGFIPGIRPGKKTAEFIDNVMSRITLPGSMFLALVAILPAFASMAGVNQSFAYFFGGTSLLIMVGVILDTLQQIESHLLMRHYDGLMKTGRIKGRTTTGMGMAG
ncbi:MAG: preprotein translocase subunit SecY [Bacteroidetes bacterium RIFCSPLOWO2_12_FULL_31_6]|nr:MAG: preprotein translocase subunit SecY [Bacteroidetes bacterium RIFCSPLOWO2_12_FULL_31_6]